MRIRARRRCAVVLSMMACCASLAGAHGGDGDDDAPGVALDEGDMQIGSAAAGGGRLLVAFDFSTPVRASYAGPLGSYSTFSAVAPGFDAPADTVVAEGTLFALRPGTRVWIELVDNDAGRTALKVRDVVLARPGDRALLGTHGDGSLHYHPEYQLVLDGADGGFGEGRLAFRLVTSAPGYAASRGYELTLSNGYLAPMSYTPGGFDAAAIRCRRVLAAQVARAMRAQARLLERCPLAQRGCGGTAGACSTPAGAPADPGLVAGELAAARAAARDAVVEACAGRIDANAVDAHMGLAGCRLERAMRPDALAVEATCAGTMARHAARFMIATQAALAPCVVALEAGKARKAAGLPLASAVAEARCAPAHGVGGDGQTPLGRIARARRLAVRAMRQTCGRSAAAAEALRLASCGAEDVVSAAATSLEDDLGAFTARPSQGGRPMPDYFPCLRGGHAHE